MKIHLIRHGKTPASEMGLYCGCTNIPLSDDGANELALRKEQGIYPAADMFFTSGLLRAGQTLTILYGNVRRKAMPGLAEYNFGSFEMKSHHELKERADYQEWIIDETGEVTCPGGESKLAFEMRVLRGYGALVSLVRESGNSSALAVCHGGVITCIMDHFFPGQKNYYEWQPVPGRGYTIIYASDKIDSYIEI